MSKKKITLLFSAIVVALFIGVFSTFNTKNVNAAGDYGKRALIADLSKCYFQGQFKPKVDLTNIYYIKDILQGSDSILAMPNTKVSGNNPFSCQTLFEKYLNVDSLGSNQKEISDTLLKLGYEGEPANNQKKRKCARIKFYRSIKDPTGNNESTNTVYSSTLCAVVDNEGNALENYSVGNAGEGGAVTLVISDDQIMISTPDGGTYYVSAPIGSNFGNVINDIDKSIPNDMWTDTGYHFVKQGVDYLSDEDMPNSGSSIYSLRPAVNASYKAIQSFLGTTDINAAFTPDERSALFSDYLSTYFTTSCTWIDNATEVTDAAGNKIFVKANSDAPSTFYIPGGDGAWFSTVDRAGFISALSGVTIPAAASCDPNNTDPQEPDPGSGGDDNVCFKGAGALGWIVCPIMSALSDVAESLYKFIEDSFLQTNVDTVLGGEVRNIWGTVRDLANVAFVILFMIVIFSQLTGIGIDNYSIKRILPRLIITAILVNFSFFICGILVDISNILGSGLKAFLESAAPAADTASNYSAVGAGVAETLVGGGVGIAVVAALVSAGAAIVPGLIVGILVGTISVVIGVLFIGLILIARQICIIVAIVLAPAALVCYMLPNTEQLFKKWWKVLLALLMVYPICALAVGGGNLASKLLAIAGEESNSPAIIIGAMITRVIPYFFIPSLLRKSLSGIGNLGEAISGFGRGISRGAGGLARSGAQRSGLYRNAMNNAKDREQARDLEREQQRAQRIVDSLRNKQKKGALSTRETNRLAKYQQRIAGYKKDEKEANYYASDQYADSMEQRFAAMDQQIAADAREQAIGTYLSSYQNGGDGGWYTAEDYNLYDGAGNLRTDNKTYNGVMDILRNGNAEQVAAMTRAMSTNDKTRSVFKQALANYTEGGVSADREGAMSAIKTEIKQNGKWKNEFDRRVNNWAVEGGSTQALSNFDYNTTNTGLADKLTQDYMVGSDDDTMKAMTKAVEELRQLEASGTITSDQAKALEGYRSAAYAALSNPANSNMKIERQNALSTIAAGYTPETVINVRKQQISDQAEATAMARFNGMTNKEVRRIAKSKKSSETERAQARAEMRRRQGGGNP